MLWYFRDLYIKIYDSKLNFFILQPINDTKRYFENQLNVFKSVNSQQIPLEEIIKTSYSQTEFYKLSSSIS